MTTQIFMSMIRLHLTQAEGKTILEELKAPMVFLVEMEVSLTQKLKL